MERSTGSSSSAFFMFVNGELVEENSIDPDWTLVQFLREKLELTGTKVACGVGGCGSCTVLLSKYDHTTNTFSHITVNTCITPLPSVFACHILTVEGLSQAGTKNCHVLQDAIARGNGTQCGFCTPGMVMSMYGHCAIEKNPTLQSVKKALQGNLCRCTGYRPILDAFTKCSGKLSGNGELDIEELGGCFPHIEGSRNIMTSAAVDFAKIESLLKTVSIKEIKNVAKLEAPNTTWYRPYSLEELDDILRQDPLAKIISGGTSTEIQSSRLVSHCVDITSIPETRIITITPTSLILGASLTVSEMVTELQNTMGKILVEKARPLRTISYLMDKFGSQQIRNAATIGGSVAIKTASDVITVLTGCNASVAIKEIGANSGQTKSILLRDFNEAKCESNHTVLQLDIPLTKPNEYTWAHKVSKRKDCDRPIINAAFKIHLNEEKDKVERIVLVFGGVAIYLFVVDISYEKAPRNLDDSLEEDIKQEISVKIVKNVVSNEYTIAYLCTAAKGIFQKFAVWLKEEVSTSKIKKPKSETNEQFQSTQLYSLVDNGQLRTDLVGRAVPHASAYKHATGEAKFCDDAPKFRKELEIAFVLSTEAHAKIKDIDASECLAVEGVVGFLSHKDLPKDKNMFGLVEKDEEIFASDKVYCVGQLVGAVVAVDRDTARKASKLVKIQYDPQEPLILSNEDAIKHNSYFSNYGMKLETGNCEQVFQSGVHVESGEVTVGSAAHFYMEPQSCIAIPKGEDGEMELISSTQNLQYVQLECARVLGVPGNHIVVKTKRIGGGFGGKESRCMLVALPAAIAAKKFGRPVRCILDRETDMIVSGKRHVFLTKHKIGFNDEGRLLALQMKLYTNAGCSLDVSMAPIERAITNVDNAYNIPNVDLDGYVCKTNIPSNTVFRGTGGPQAAFLIENIMDHISAVVNRDPVEVRKLNMYKEGDVTPYGQKLENCTIHRCWDECLRLSNYNGRRDAINTFNKNNLLKKKGIAVTNCHFGIGYTALHLNQGAALVHIYTDGSVLVNHSGVEIGQGVHSKMIQVATRALGVPASKIRILETATDKVPNATPSSASVTSDLSGGAVLNACNELSKRLLPFKKSNPNATWEKIVTSAYMNRVSLSATGFYSVPNMGWDANRRGSPWNYFSTGTACSEVEIDCLTGQYQILRTDIVMDVGESLNPAVDIGQIEGAFMQGVGLFALEELILDTNGNLLTTGPNTYKIPTAGDAPLQFNVSILSGSSNPRAIYSSKTVGEPPLLLASSVFFAIKDAIRAHRNASGIKPINFHMDSPATIENILLACRDLSKE